MDIDYCIISRGTHADYQWSKPCPEAEELFSIGRDEEAPLIILKVNELGDKASLLLGGIASQIRCDRTGTRIRDAIFLPSLAESHARAILVKFAEDPKIFAKAMDESISFNESSRGWIEANASPIRMLLQKTISEFNVPGKKWNSKLQMAEPFHETYEADYALRSAVEIFKNHRLPTNCCAPLAVFTKYLRMERKFDEYCENSFLIRSDIVKNSFPLPKKKYPTPNKSLEILSLPVVLPGFFLLKILEILFPDWSRLKKQQNAWLTKPWIVGILFWIIFAVIHLILPTGKHHPDPLPEKKRTGSGGRDREFSND